MLGEQVFNGLFLANGNNEFEGIKRRPGVMLVKLFAKAVDPVLIHREKATPQTGGWGAAS